MAALSDPLQAVERGIGVFLEVCAEPGVQRILLVDAPAVLGWTKWREMDSRHGLGLIKQTLSAAMKTGLLGRQDVEVLAHLLWGAMTEAAMFVGRPLSPSNARKAAERALASVIQSWRLVD